MAESIGCCGSWDECADKGYCVKESVMKARDQYCQYNDNLVQGFNFHNAAFKAGPYLELENRQYFIGRKTPEGIRRLNQEESDLLKSSGLNLQTFSYLKARIEITDRKDIGGCEVLATIDGLEVILMKANGERMKAPAIEKLAEALTKLRIRFQIVENGEATNAPNEPIQTVTKEELTAGPTGIADTSNTKLRFEQVSLFDIFG